MVALKCAEVVIMIALFEVTMVPRVGMEIAWDVVMMVAMSELKCMYVVMMIALVDMMIVTTMMAWM